MVRKGEESKHDCKVDSMINIRMHSRRNGLLGVHRFIAALVCGGACDKMDERVMQHQGYCASWRWWRPPGNSGRTDGCDALEGIRNDIPSVVNGKTRLGHFQEWSRVLALRGERLGRGGARDVAVTSNGADQQGTPGPSSGR